MRRWLTILLLFLMPLQLSWAASGAYCQHESDAQRQHWGHHEHQASTEEGRQLDRAQKNDVGNLPTSPADHAACGFGQAQQAAIELECLPAIAPQPHAALAMAASARYISHISDVPVRPVRLLAL